MARRCPASPIDGVPVTVKENLARAGVPMPAGNAGVVPLLSPSAAVPSSNASRRLAESSLARPSCRTGECSPPECRACTASRAARGIPRLTTGGSSSGRRCGRRGGLRPAPRRHRHRRIDPPARDVARPDDAQAECGPRPPRRPLPRAGSGAHDALGRRCGDPARRHQPTRRTRDWTALPAERLELDDLTAGGTYDVAGPAGRSPHRRRLRAPRSTPRCARRSRRPPRSSRLPAPGSSGCPPFLTPPTCSAHSTSSGGFARCRPRCSGPSAQERVLPFIRRWVEAARRGIGAAAHAGLHAS